MWIVFFLLPLILVSIAAVVFNHKLTDSSLHVKAVYSSLEIIAVVCLTLLLFQFGYIRSSTDVILLVLFTTLSMIGLYLCTEYFNDNFYEQASVVFNALLFYAKTVLVFLFAMTVLRYQVVWLQVIIGLASVAVVFRLSLWLEPRIVRYINNLIQTIRNYDKYELIVVPFLLVISLMFLIEAPNQPIGQLFNVNNHIRYLVFDTDIPTDVNVNFEQDQTLQVTVDDLRVFARDYYYNDNYLYIYVNDNDSSALVSGRLLIYDRDTGDLLYNELTLNETVTAISKEAYNISESQEHFILYENELLFFASDGIYLIEGITLQKLSDVSFSEAMYYYQDNNLYFLLPLGNREYNIYQYNNQAVTLFDTLDLNNGEILSLQVVNAHLLEYTSDGYFYETPTNLYDFNEEGYFSDGDEGYIYHYNTIYDPNSQLFYQFEYDNTHHQVLRIYQEDGTLYGYFVHSALHTWFILNHYNINTDIEYRILDNQLTFMLVSNKEQTTTFTLYDLNYLESPLELPFYAHFSMTTFWIILLSIVVPFLNNEKFYTFVDYDSVLKKQDEPS